MSIHMYKYVGQSYLDKVFSIKDYVTLKCSYPKEFNDPYELFLTIDFDERPEILALYADAVGKIPQLPTTCFSRSPEVIPMWAHYGQNLKGFCIEFDEKLLSEYFPESQFGDVDYRNEPESGLTDTLYRAYEIGKYRYMHILLNGVFSSAYYTKATHWDYEQERRMIIGENETQKSNELIFIDVPNDCVSSLICGPRASAETITFIREKADYFNCSYFQLKIGRTSPTPYFMDRKGNPFTFNHTDIKQCEQHCVVCKEPIFNDQEKCSWCQINELDRREAALRNPYRMLEQYGLLDTYIDGMNAIDDKGERE
ncbi:MAG: DUF2971 domain-containing protein [Chloroflexi bacterium]|nr:DUF2971 domain-containing protein [Chloroflexota bacterium]